jgi:peptidase E
MTRVGALTYLVRMLTRPPQIVAFGGGGFSTEWGNPLLDEHVLALTGVPRPRVCFLPTASGDADHYIVRFYRAFPSALCDPSHISLFRRETGVGDPRAHLLAQDLIYVGGGSLISLMGTWRAHGIDATLHEAWRAGVVLCGGSAGSLCWFSHAVSCFHEGPPRRLEGLGFLPWSNAVHYSDEPGRRSAFLGAVSDGMPPGFGVGDAAALHFVGTELAEIVSSRPQARARYVFCDGAGDVGERDLPVRYLGATQSGEDVPAGELVRGSAPATRLVGNSGLEARLVGDPGPDERLVGDSARAA